MTDEPMIIDDVEQEQLFLLPMNGSHRGKAHLNDDCPAIKRSDNDPRTVVPEVLLDDKPVCERCSGDGWQDGAEYPDTRLADRIRNMSTDEKREWFND